MWPSADRQHSANLRTRHVSSAPVYVQSGRRVPPPGLIHRPRGLGRRDPPAHWFQYAVGRPTQVSWKRSRSTGAKSARPGARYTAGARRAARGPAARSPHGQQSRHPELRPLTVGMWRTTLGLRMPRAYAAKRRASVCRGVTHVQGATRAERKARNRSRPRGNQQRRPGPAGQRPRGSTRSDTPLRQDLRGAMGVEGDGSAGCGAPSHRRRHRSEAGTSRPTP